MPSKRRFLFLSVLPALLLVQSPVIHAGPQQDRMKSCNAEAKEKTLKGDERRTFMKSCLSSASAAKTQAADQSTVLEDRKRQCRDEAKEKALKGDERKSFLSDCMKV